MVPSELRYQKRTIYWREYSMRKDVKNKKIKYRQSLDGKFLSYKKSARERNIEFNLTKEEFEFFWQKQCSYCGREIATIGIDRVDNNIGYKLDNCISCCTICNKMKLNYTEEEWFNNMYMVLKFKGVV